ncbi:2OG-Fe(II) oxygenase [Bacteriovoracales bacterium]|nr:2OG-Fe(II) oxygenase [Bacteriovoracales bacterium]
MGLTNEILEKGYEIVQLDLGPEIQDLILKKDWASLDAQVESMCQKEGLISRALKKFRYFSTIEHIISLRKDPDEDGIWHDDGSRQLAFSLSLNLNPENIEGGELSIRKKGNPDRVGLIETLPFGSMIIFLTGHDHFEHKTHRVKKGKRLVAAGWCTE